MMFKRELGRGKFLASVRNHFLGGILLAVPFSIFSADWPHWRGPLRNGHSTETNGLQTWPAAGPNIAWKARVGQGLSSFVVAANRAYTLGHANGLDTVWCFDATTGKIVWKYSYPADLGDKYFDGGTTGTPTLDGDQLFVLSRWGDFFCFDAATGKIVWSKNVQKETGIRLPDWGYTGAPLVHQNLIVLNIGEAGVALQKSSGKIVWKSADKNAGYSTPLPEQRHGQWVGWIGNGTSYLAVNLATGKEVYRIRWVTEYGVNAADPIISGDQIFLSTGYGKGGALFKLGAPGSEPEQLWKTRQLRTQMNAAVLFQGHLYGVDGNTTEQAALKCLEFASGKEMWSHPSFGTGGLIVADGKLIALSGKGELLIAPAVATGFKPVAQSQVLGGQCWTAPVLADGKVYCRNSRGDVAVVDLTKN